MASSTASPSLTAEMSESRPRNETAKEVGIAVGVVVGVLLLGFIIFWFHWRTKRRRSESIKPPDDTDEQEPTTPKEVSLDKSHIQLTQMEEIDLEKGIQKSEQVEALAALEGSSSSTTSRPTSYHRTSYPAPIVTRTISKSTSELKRNADDLHLAPRRLFPTRSKLLSLISLPRVVSSRPDGTAHNPPLSLISRKPTPQRIFDTYEVVDSSSDREHGTLNPGGFRETNHYEFLEGGLTKAQKAQQTSMHHHAPETFIEPTPAAQHNDRTLYTQAQTSDGPAPFVEHGNHKVYVCPRLMEKLNLPADAEQRYRQAHEEAFDRNNSEEVRRKGRKRIRKIEKRYPSLYEEAGSIEKLGLRDGKVGMQKSPGRLDFEQYLQTSKTTSSV